MHWFASLMEALVSKDSRALFAFHSALGGLGCSTVVIFWLLSPAAMHYRTTSALKLPPRALALQCIVLYTHWPPSLCSTLVLCLVSLSPELLPTFTTQHSLLSYWPTCSLLLLVLSQVLTSCSTPLVPVLGHIIPVLTNLHSCQIFLCQVPTSSSWTSAGLCLGQLPKKTLHNRLMSTSRSGTPSLFSVVHNSTSKMESYAFRRSTKMKCCFMWCSKAFSASCLTTNSMSVQLHPRLKPHCVSGSTCSASVCSLI